MTRKKVELAYITNDSKRRTTFRKRKNGLIKKIDEISTLCGIEACAIIYSTPTDIEPGVWPSEWGVHNVVSKFKRVPELEQSKKMMNQESFLRQRIVKAQEQLKRVMNENRKKEMTRLMLQYLTVGKIFDIPSLIDLNDVSCVIDQHLKEIEKKIKIQAQMETPLMVENGGETMDNEGEQAPMNHVQGLVETNVDTIQNQPWSMDFINGNGRTEMVPFGDVNVKINDPWAKPYVP